MIKEVFFDVIKASSLYLEAKEDLDTLMKYLDIPVEEGSLAFIYGLQQVQNEYLDKLPYIARFAGVIPDLSLETAVLVIKALRIQYEEHIKSMSAIRVCGLDKYIHDYVDQTEQYYVPLDARDASVDPYISKKPTSLADMAAVACYDVKHRLVQSVWKELYGEKAFRYFELREKVGFDRAQFNVDITSIDVDKLLAAQNKSRSQSYHLLPRIVIERIDPEDKEDLPLRLPLENHDFKKIEVTLSHHVTFLFQRNNSPIELNGVRKRDIYLLKTTVEPISGHEVLGNIRNYDYDEMGEVIQKAIVDLEDLTGIVIDRNSVRLNDVELNLTFRQNCKFDELMRSVSYYQNYTRKGYTTKEFKAADEGIVHFCVDMSDCYTKDLFTKKRKKIERQYSRMKTTGFVTSSKSIIVKLYDKKEETMAYAAAHGYDLKFEGEDEAIIRLEFRIKNSGQLQNYFETDDRPVYFRKLSQERLEETYIDLVNSFFKHTYEKEYVPESTNALIAIISKLNTSVKGGRWKEGLVKTILSQEVWQKSTPALLTEKDIASVLQYNPTFARKPKKYLEILMNLLQEDDYYKKGQTRAYDMLYNFLHKTYNLKTLSEYRRAAYAISDWGFQLPFVSEEEIEMRQNMKNMWVDFQNIPMEEFQLF